MTRRAEVSLGVLVLLSSLASASAEPAPAQGRYDFSEQRVSTESAAVVLHLELDRTEAGDRAELELRLLSIREPDVSLALRRDVDLTGPGPFRLDWPVDIPLKEYELWLAGAKPRVEWTDPAVEPAVRREFDLHFGVLEALPATGGGGADHELPDGDAAATEARR